MPRNGRITDPRAGGENYNVSIETYFIVQWWHVICTAVFATASRPCISCNAGDAGSDNPKPPIDGGWLRKHRWIFHRCSAMQDDFHFCQPDNSLRYGKHWHSLFGDQEHGQGNPRWRHCSHLSGANTPGYGRRFSQSFGCQHALCGRGHRIGWFFRKPLHLVR